MLYNLDTDIIIDDKLLKENFYYYFSKYNVSIFFKSEISNQPLKNKILYFTNYEYTLDYTYDFLETIDDNLRLGENTYLLSKNSFLSLPDLDIKKLETKYYFFKTNHIVNISFEKFMEYRSFHHDFKNIYNENSVYKNILDFLSDFSIIPYVFLITDQLPNCINILKQVLSIFDENYDMIYVFLENPNLDIIKLIQKRKNIKLFRNLTLDNIVENTSSFQEIILLKDEIPILKKRENIDKVNFPNLVKITKSHLVLQQLKLNFKNIDNITFNILEDNIDNKINLENFEITNQYIENLFFNKCYKTAFEITEKFLDKIREIRLYNEFVIKYFSLGLIIGQTDKISNNLEKLFKNNFTLAEYDELLPIIYSLPKSQQCISVIINKLVESLNIEKIDFIEKIIDNFANKILDQQLIKSILLFIKNSKEIQILEKERFNNLLEKCYKLSSHLIVGSNDVLDFWTNIYLSEDNNLNISKLYNNYKHSPEFIYYISLNIPIVFKTNKELEDKRNIVDTSLNFFNKNWEQTIPLLEIYKYPSLNFRHSYHGKSNRELFSKSSKFFRKICPELNYKANLDYKNEKIKILFVSEFLGRQHSVFKDRHQVIKYLSLLDDFEIHFTTFNDISLAITRFEFGKAKHINIPKNIIKAKEIIEKEQYDIIFYCEIGMAVIPYFLAHMKLAKYQFNTWGHSDTSGINSIDYFISSKYFELEYNEAQKHYTEKLILMDSLSTCYVNPLIRHPNKKWLSRKDYGYSDNITIYSCLQSSFKYSPDFIKTLELIMNEDKDAILLITAKENKDKVFLELISNLSFSNRIHKFYQLQHDEYLNLIKISDIVLETFPFGSCNSSLEAFSLGIPVVTYPSNMINGRFTLGFYNYMNINNMIAYNEKEYVDLSLKLSKNKDFYKEISSEIKKNSYKLYMDMETCREYEKIFRNLKL